MCGKDAVVDIKLDCQWKLIKEHRVSRTVILSLLRIKGGLGFIQRVWELQVFEGILQFFFFLRLLIFIQNYTALVFWKPDLILMAWSFLLSWKQYLEFSWEEGKKKSAWYVHLDYLSKVVCFLHSPVCEVCLRATSVTSLGSDRE